MSEIHYHKKVNKTRDADDYEEVVETWFKIEDNQVVLHNDDGPAYIRTIAWEDAPEYHIEYRKDGRIHREDGPAVIHPTSAKEYFYMGYDAEHLRLLAHAKGVTAQSWADLVAFAKREKI